MNATENTSLSVPDFQTPLKYTGFGVGAVVANLIVASVLAFNKTLLKKSAFIAGLCFADILNGCFMIIMGSLRLSYTKAGTLGVLVHPFTCMKKITIMWILAMQLNAVLMFLIGAERASAIVFFKWYYDNWSNKLAWSLTGAAYIFCCCAVTTIAIVVYFLLDDKLVTQDCTTPYVIGPAATLYNYLMPIFCGALGVVATFVCLIGINAKRNKAKRRATSSSSMADYLKKQWNITVSMTVVLFVDFILVVVPNIFKLIASFYPPLQFIGYYGAFMICTRAMLSLAIYMALNRDFRSSFVNMVKIKTNASIVSPLSGNKMNPVN